MRQRQRLQKKLRFVLRPLRNGRGPPSAGEHSHHCDDDDADERMFDINRSAWVFQLVKVVDDVFDADALDLRHNFLLQEPCKRYNPKVQDGLGWSRLEKRSQALQGCNLTRNIQV